MRTLLSLLLVFFSFAGIGQDTIPDAINQPFYGVRQFVNGTDTAAFFMNKDTIIWVSNDSLNYYYIKDTLLARDYQGTWKGLDTSDYLFLDQSTPQTITDSLPFLQESRIITENHHLVDKLYVDNAVTSLGQRFYMLSTLSGVAGYYNTQITASNNIESSITATDPVDEELVAGWISSSAGAPSVLIAGLYEWDIYAEKTGGNKTFKMHWQLIERKADNSEVVIATSAKSDFIDEKERYQIPLNLSDDYDVASDSRIVGKIYVDVISGASATDLVLYVEGDSDSHWEIPTNKAILDNSYVNYTDTISTIATKYDIDTVSGGGTTSPAGTDGQLQYNDNGSLAGADLITSGSYYLGFNNYEVTEHTSNFTLGLISTLDDMFSWRETSGRGTFAIGGDDASLYPVDNAFAVEFQDDSSFISFSGDRNGSNYSTDSDFRIGLRSGSGADVNRDAVINYRDTMPLNIEQGGNNFMELHDDTMKVNQYAKFNSGSNISGSSLWNESGSDIYYNDGNVGIGTSTPSGLLHIYDNSSILYPQIENISASGRTLFAIKSDNAFFDMRAHGSTYSGTLFENSVQNSSLVSGRNGKLIIGTYENYDFVLGTNNSERMRIQNDGKVGIGTPTPSAPLEVTGEARLTSTTDMGSNDESLATKKYVDDNVQVQGILNQADATQDIVFEALKNDIPNAGDIILISGGAQTTTYNDNINFARATRIDANTITLTGFNNTNALSYQALCDENDGTTIFDLILISW